MAVEDLDEMNIEILRNTLYKAYLDDFARFCTGLGGATAEIMGDLLSFEVTAASSPCVPFISAQCLLQYLVVHQRQYHGTPFSSAALVADAVD